MSHTPDAATAGNGGKFDPQQAAALLGQTTQQARRQLEPSPPWLLAIRAVGVLATCIAVWLSVRGQHPYRHPTGTVIPVLVAFVIVNFVATVTVRRRATTGVSGRSQLRGTDIALLVAAFAGAAVVMGALAGAGASTAFVYTVYPATVPLLAAGLVWAAINATRGNWRECASGLAVAVTCTVGVFAGPVDVWLVLGIGLCAALLGGAAAGIWRQRRNAVRP
jgi:hypothetical protein